MRIRRGLVVGLAAVLRCCVIAAAVPPLFSGCLKFGATESTASPESVRPSPSVSPSPTSASIPLAFTQSAIEVEAGSAVTLSAVGGTGPYTFLLVDGDGSLTENQLGLPSTFSATRVKVIDSLGANAYQSIKGLRNPAFRTAFGTEGKWSRSITGGAISVASSTIDANGRAVVFGEISPAAPNTLYIARLGLDGNLDNSFGTAGVVRMPGAEGALFWVGGLTSQADGKLIFTGTEGTSCVVGRIKSDGSLDATFGAGGVKRLNFGPSCTSKFVKLQSNGKIVVGGISGGASAMAFRLTATGDVDTTFGPVASGHNSFSSGSLTHAYAAAIQGDDKILLGGTSDNRFVVARLTANGTLDAGYGSGGLALIDIGSGLDFVNAITIDENGKAVAVGTAVNMSGTSQADTDVIAVRLLDNGTLDAGFGNAGMTRLAVKSGSYEQGRSVVIASDASIYVGGHVSLFENDFVVFKLNGNGVPDNAYGLGGMIGIDFGFTFDGATSIHSLQDGSLLMVGGADNKLLMTNFSP